LQKIVKDESGNKESGSQAMLLSLESFGAFNASKKENIPTINQT